MSLTRLLVHTVTIRRPGVATDRYGASVKDWATATDTEVSGRVVQTSGVEVNDLGREGERSDWTAYFPVGTDVIGGDRVLWGSTTFEVDGPPNRAWDADSEHHVEARLKLVEG